MKDIKYIIGFTALGLLLAYAFSGPLRKPANQRPQVGTPLAEARVYAKGVVRVDPSLQTKAQNVAALFLIARTPQGGPPVAVRKYDFPKLPLEYALTQNNNMVGEGFYEGDLKLIARLDKDGLAGPLEEGDYEAVIQVKKDQDRHIDIVIK